MKKQLVCYFMLAITPAALADGHFFAELETAFEESKGFPFRTVFPSSTEGSRKYHGRCFSKDDTEGFDRSMTVEVKAGSAGGEFFGQGEEKVLLNGTDAEIDIDGDTFSRSSATASHSLRVVERNKGKKYLLSRTTDNSINLEVMCWYAATP